jgi:hypothetical protein
VERRRNQRLLPFLSHVGLEHERYDEAVDGDRLDEDHAQNEVHEHRPRRTRVAGDAGGGVAGGQTLTDATAETRHADGETRSNTEATDTTSTAVCGEGGGRSDKQDDCPHEDVDDTTHSDFPSFEDPDADFGVVGVVGVAGIVGAVPIGCGSIEKGLA